MSNAFLFNPVRLSLEIINSIFFQLKDIKDINALGQVATPFRRPSQRLLFSSVDLRISDRCPKLYALGEDVLSLVKTLNVDGSQSEAINHQPPDTFPHIMRGLENIIDLTLIRMSWNLACQDALQACGNHLTRLRLDSVELPSLQMLWDILSGCYETLYELELGNITLISRELEARTAPATHHESRLELLSLNFRTEDDVYIMHLLSGDDNPIVMANVETLSITDVALWSSQLTKSLVGLWNKLSDCSAKFVTVEMGDPFDLSDELVEMPMVDIGNMKNIDFDVIIKDARTVSPSLVWWTKCFLRSKPRQWELITINLKVTRKSSGTMYDIRTLFPDANIHRIWCSLNLALRCLPRGGYDPCVVVRVQIDVEHSQEDFEYMKGWVRRRLIMPWNRGLLHIT